MPTWRGPAPGWRSSGTAPAETAPVQKVVRALTPPEYNLRVISFHQTPTLLIILFTVENSRLRQGLSGWTNVSDRGLLSSGWYLHRKVLPQSSVYSSQDAVIHLGSNDEIIRMRIREGWNGRQRFEKEGLDLSLAVGLDSWRRLKILESRLWHSRLCENGRGEDFEDVHGRPRYIE